MSRKVWITKDSKLPLIIKDSSWRFIHDFKDISSCTGVFIFATASHQVKYIGATQSNCLIEAIQEAISNGYSEKSTIVKALYTSSDKDANIVRNVLLEKYSPKLNEKVSPSKQSIAGG